MQINLMPDLSLLAVMVIFIINYFVVRKFFLQPINSVLEDRQHETKTADEIYEEAMSRFNTAIAEIEEHMHVAKRDATQVREGFRAEAAAYRATVVERTALEAKQLVADADSRLAHDVKSAREKIVHESESLARLAAERILGRTI